MFGKLRDKLKGALSAFSKKTEEEAQEIPAQELEELEQQVDSEPREDKKDSEIQEEKQSPPDDERQEVAAKSDKTSADEAEDDDSELSAEEAALADALIEDAAKDDAPEVPSTFEAGQMQYVADKEKIDELKEQTIQKSEAKVVTASQEKEKDPEKKKFRLFKKKEKKEAKEKKVEPKDEPLVETEQAAVIESKETVDKEIVEALEQKKTKREAPSKPVSEKQPASAKEPAPEKKGFFAKATQALTTRKIDAEKFEDLFWDLEIILLEHNVSVEVIERMKNDLKEVLVDKPLPRNVMQKIEQTLRSTLEDILSHEPLDLLALSSEKKPLVIAFFGINGAGKTTSVAKIAHYFKKQGKSCVLAACDTFRAAAIQQIEEHAKNLDVKLIKHDYGSDAAAVAFDAVAYAKKNDIDIVLIDTAGRLHSNTNLMNELEKVIRVAKPDLNIFVGESITGNDCIEQAVEFNKLVSLDGAILTKADVDEKGGAPLSISYMIKKPILFLGVGQTYDDLEVFDKEKIISRLGF